MEKSILGASISSEFVIGIFLSIVTIFIDHLLKKPVFGPESSGWILATRRIMIAYYVVILALILPYLFLLLWFIPYFFLFDPESINPQDSPSVITILVVVFVLCTTIWHYIFYCFPIVMETLGKILGNNGIANFPKLIDYSYYLFGSIGIAYAYIEITNEPEVSSIDKRLFFVFYMLILSLRFTKVTLERKEDFYLKSDAHVRSFDGVVLIRRQALKMLLKSLKIYKKFDS